MIIDGLRYPRLEEKRGYFYYRFKNRVLCLGRTAQDAIKAWAMINSVLSENPMAYDDMRIKRTFSPNKATFREVKERYLEEEVKHKAPCTIQAYTRALKSLEQYFGANTPVDMISRPRVYEYKDSMRHFMYECNLHLRVLSAMYFWASDRGYINISPFAHIRKYKEERYKLNLTVEILFNDIFPHACDALQRGIMLAWNLVQHDGEVCRMKYTHFDRHAQKVSFVRQKTNTAITIDYSENRPFSRFMDGLFEERDRQEAEGEHWNMSPFIVYRLVNNPKPGCGPNLLKKPYTTLNKPWREALERAGLKGRYYFKEIRHLANTTLKDAGISADQRCKLTGHKSISTNERYTHETGTETIEAGRALGQQQEGEKGELWTQ